MMAVDFWNLAKSPALKMSCNQILNREEKKTRTANFYFTRI